ncbi:neural cell adhesion molecule L1.1-like [Astyanax mexicanus]|uniref:Neural cell adhesion molecule L1.1-like n=1 Tax=Astyanax mexicanus TaxID=7994 RepID=A0A8T2LEM0_ASTMX|nr:neural cell adhesion molecule L1.1-like [Astyanax mexicanus]
MGQRTMPPAQCQPAPTRGRLSAPCLLFTSLHLLLLLLQGAQAAIHIPKDFKQPPVITYQTRSYTAFYQDDVSLRCEASGNPAPTYRWVKDGTLYVEESSITANETDDLKSYQGKYRCYVSNELGTAMSDEIELITDSTPILPKEKRVRKTVHEGDSVVLHCNPPNSSVTPYIHWMDRKLMHIPQSDRVTIGLDGNLYFANVLNKDTRDDYTCNAQYSAARTILPKEPISLHVTPCERKGMKLSWHRDPAGHCNSYTVYSPRPQYTFHSNPPHIVSSCFLLFSYSLFLFFPSLALSLSLFLVLSLSPSVSLSLSELPPQILTEDKVMYNLTEGSSVFLDCRAFGSPPPKITWQNEFGELALENARATQFANGSLQITDVMREDSGMYFCSVKNLSISATLAVMNRTRIINPPQDLHVPRGQAAVLQCEYQVDQELLDPTILWRKDNNKIMTSAQDDKYTVFENGSLKITDVQQKDAGSYSCEVMTKLDADKASGSITVVDKPDAPHSLRLSEKSSRSVTLSWIPGNENNSPVSEYVIEVREEMHGLSEVKRVSAEMNHLEIPLLPFCTYNFRVTAVNDIGTSDFSLPSESYTTPPAKPDKNPGSVRSESTDPKSMVITWEEVDRRHFNGPGFRYKVMWRQAAGQGPKWNEDFVSHPPFTVNNTDTFSAFEIKVQALNDLGHGPSPAPKLGHSGEDTPLKPPTGVAVNQYNDTAVTITWTAVDRESVRGHLLGYKIHLKRLGPHQEHHGNRKRLLERSREESWEIDVLRDEKEEKIVSGLEYYSNYQLSITAHNSKGEGPPSDPVHFNTPEGVPGAPTDLRCESPSQTKLSLHWNHPHKPNGVLRGYVLHYQAQGVDGSPSEVQMVTIHDPSLNNYTLDNLDSQSRYFFSLRAETHAGLGEEAKVNATTLLDGEPPNYVNATVGETSVNLSWVPGHRHRNVGFTIHYLRKSAGGEWEESEQVNSTQAFYELQGLQSGTEYVLEIRHKNITYWTQGLQTNGPRLSEVQNGFASQGWFIGLISAVVLLLLILLILCFIKRSRGGKYSVKDKEEGQVDSDARPMKDEAFGEYSSDNDEKRSISQPSLCPDSKRGSDDSLAEYGDSVDIQFNEDGSFIGQYSGRRDHHAHADRDSSGAASPTNPNMPRPSMSFPNSVTGILGGN